MTDIIFQVLEWATNEEEMLIDVIDDDGESNVLSVNKHVIRMYGKTKDDKSVYVKVINFKPFFYVKVLNWSNTQVIKFINYFKKKFEDYKTKPILDSYELVEKMDLLGFSNYTKFKFIKLSFHNIQDMKTYVKLFYTSHFIPGLTKKFTKFQL